MIIATAGLALQNHCVEGRLEWLTNDEPITTTVLIPISPVAAASSRRAWMSARVTALKPTDTTTTPTVRRRIRSCNACRVRLLQAPKAFKHGMPFPIVDGKAVFTTHWRYMVPQWYHKLCHQNSGNLSISCFRRVSSIGEAKAAIAIFAIPPVSILRLAESRAMMPNIISCGM